MTSACSILSVLAVVLLFDLTGAEAQLPKKGPFSGGFGWLFPTTAAQVIEVEEGHFIWGGTWSGAFRNDAGEGFLHGAVLACTSAGEYDKSAQIHNSGNCVETDKDGDKIFAAWSCTECPGKTAGTFKWTGGTGKYTGITVRAAVRISQQTPESDPLVVSAGRRGKESGSCRDTFWFP